MMIRTRDRRLVSRLEALERVYDTRGPRVFRVIFEYGGEPTIVTIFRDENRTEIIEPPPPDDDPDEFYGACESTETLNVAPAPQPDDETPSSFPVGANASLSIRRGTACRAHSPTRGRNGLRPFRVVRISKWSSHAIPHRGNLRHAKTSRARETEPQPSGSGPAAENRAEPCPSGRGPAGFRPRLCAVMFSKLTVELASETWVRCGISGPARLPTAVSRPRPRCRP